MAVRRDDGLEGGPVQPENELGPRTNRAPGAAMRGDSAANPPARDHKGRYSASLSETLPHRARSGDGPPMTRLVGGSQWPNITSLLGPSHRPVESSRARARSRSGTTRGRPGSRLSRNAIRVIVDGYTIADTTDALRVLETAGAPVYYIPPVDVRKDLLEPTAHHSFCEWKGEASYWSIRLPDRTIPNAAFGYLSPTAGYESIQDHIAFYPALVDEAWVGDEQATSQPGRFYAGWVTSKVVGPFKGEPGTQGW